MPSQPQTTVDTFANPAPERDYQIEFTTNEFTCVCPLTGQPDFGTLHIVYVPDQLCVELKSLKLFLWSFRQEGHFHEAVTNQILSHLVKVLSPRSMTVTGIFNIRGGIQTTVTASYAADNRAQR